MHDNKMGSNFEMLLIIIGLFIKTHVTQRVQERTIADLLILYIKQSNLNKFQSYTLLYNRPTLK